MWLVALVLLAGCQRLLDLQPVHLTDASGAFDDSRAGDGTGDADGPPSMLVQEVTAASESSSLSVSLATKPEAGHVLIAIGGAENGVKEISGAGTAWKLAASSTISPTIQIWFGETDGSSPTITLEGNAGKIWLEVSEWRGLAPMNTFEVGDGSGASIIDGPTGNISLAVITQSAPDLVVFGVACYGAIGPPSGSWTALDGVSSSFVMQGAWYRLAPTAGTQAADAMCVEDYDAALAAFRTMP